MRPIAISSFNLSLTPSTSAKRRAVISDDVKDSNRQEQAKQVAARKKRRAGKEMELPESPLLTGIVEPS